MLQAQVIIDTADIKKLLAGALGAREVRRNRRGKKRKAKEE
jgi:hypothetical protein